jgi:hypothetical protein
VDEIYIRSVDEVNGISGSEGGRPKQRLIDLLRASVTNQGYESLE